MKELGSGEVVAAAAAAAGAASGASRGEGFLRRDGGKGISSTASASWRRDLRVAAVLAPPAAAQRQQHNAKQMQQVVKAVEKACENRAVELRARVEQLEAAMLAAGLELPQLPEKEVVVVAEETVDVQMSF